MRHTTYHLIESLTDLHLLYTGSRYSLALTLRQVRALDLHGATVLEFAALPTY
jgi:hypothetical protein